MALAPGPGQLILTPRALIAANAALVRSLISSRPALPASRFRKSFQAPGVRHRPSDRAHLFLSPEVAACAGLTLPELVQFCGAGAMFDR